MIKNVLAITALIILTAALHPPLNGQTPRFHHYTGRDGLSQNTVFAICQDQRGFLWLGTEEGLNRFDGYQFRIFQHNPDDPTTLSHNRIMSIYQDSQGVLWVGAQGGGLNRYNSDTETFTRFFHRGENADGPSNNTIWRIFEDSSGALWLGTGDGLNRFDRKTMNFTVWRPLNEAKNPNGFSVRAIAEDQNGWLWLGTLSHGLLLFDKKTEAFYPMPPPEQFGEKTFSKVISLLFTGKKRETLWVGADTGLRCVNPATRSFLPLPEKIRSTPGLTRLFIPDIFPDHDGRLWFATFSGGLYRYDEARNRLDHYFSNSLTRDSLSNDDVYSIKEDQSGVLWVGSAKGLNKLDKKQARFGYWEVLPESGSSNEDSVVWSLCRDRRGVVWLGTGAGILRLNRETGEFNRFSPETYAGARDKTGKNTVWSIFEDQDGNMWFSISESGLYRYSPHSGACQRFAHDSDRPGAISSNEVRIIFGDSRGNLWLGTENGLNRLDRYSHTFTHYLNDPNDNNSISHNSINAIIEDRQGNLWIGAQGGLNRLNIKTGRFTRWVRENGYTAGLSHESISCLCSDRNGILWIGAKGGGLNRFDPVSQTFSHFTRAQGLPSNTIHAILEDNSGHLWLSSNSGLTRFNPSHRVIEFTNYDYGDGLQENEFNEQAAHRSRDGELFFGGINGFNAFYPERIRNNDSTPRAAITSLKILNRDPGIGGNSPLNRAPLETTHLFLSYKQSILEFHFTGLDFSNPGKNKFKYKLEGFDREWNCRDASSRFAKYTNVEPGRYVFQVRACNNDGVWDNTGASIHIVISPPFWLTWWFRVFAALAFAIGSYFLINFITRYITMSSFWRREKYVGKYKLEEKIGGGGMGAIYRARDTTDNNKSVAIKILREELFGDEVYQKRFKQEAAIIDQLDHPNIVRVLERGQHRQKLFIVMELLRGVTLAQKIEKEYKICFAELAEIMLQIAEALIKIHGRNIVHRDLKPDNIMLLTENSSKNFVKLLDFGLALNRFQSRITQTGTVLGTVNYMAPEQISYGDFSFASDMYSLGVIFYEAATSQVPFPGDNISEIMRKILKSSPLEPKHLRPDLPDSFNALIMELLAKEPERRPGAHDVATRLRRYQNTGD